MAANPIRYINPDPASNVITVGDDVLGEHVQVTSLPTLASADTPLEAQDRPAASVLEMILSELQQMRLLLEILADSGDYDSSNGD